MYYLIKDTLEEATYEDCISKKEPFVAVMNRETFQNSQEDFGFGIDVAYECTADDDKVTKAEVNFDSLTGSFAIPIKNHSENESEKYFEFVLDERGIVFIDNSGSALEYIQHIKKTKKWRMPSLERFLFDFIETITKKDLSLLQKYENEMDQLEAKILDGSEDDIMERLSGIRGELQDLRVHYEQLIDVCQELEENENNFFQPDNLRYFRLANDRLQRLKDLVASNRDYSMQLRDLYHYQLDVKQNKVTTLLTVVATIFMPLTLIVGWYGMNFVRMPELAWEYGYPVVIGISIIVVIIEILFFKKKKWL